MNKELIAGLTKMDEVEYNHLRLNMQVAEICRAIMKEFNWEKEAMCTALDISAKRWPAYINGAYPYDFMDLAKLQALQARLRTATLKFKFVNEAAQAYQEGENKFEDQARAFEQVPAGKKARQKRTSK